MQVYICIDDTDILGGFGTGVLAAQLASDIAQLGWGKCSPVTRHQLFVHVDIPYTSHNSTMCFEADINAENLTSLIVYSQDFLAKKSADGSDPGLCVAVADRLVEPGLLLAYGYRAKQAVISKEEAYELAKQLGIHLSEHGGTGQGVIGALAGVGLRIGGCDGRFKGKYQIGPAGSVLTAAQILEKTGVDQVRGTDGSVLSPEERVRLGEKVKSVLIGGKNVLLVCRPEDGGGPAEWQTCLKEFLRRY
jgi:hypothetical protein